jgi:hypothetical protein
MQNMDRIYASFPDPYILHKYASHFVNESRAKVEIFRSKSLEKYWTIQDDDLNTPLHIMLKYVRLWGVLEHCLPWNLNCIKLMNMQNKKGETCMELFLKYGQRAPINIGVGILEVSGTDNIRDFLEEAKRIKKYDLYHELIRKYYNNCNDVFCCYMIALFNLSD